MPAKTYHLNDEQTDTLTTKWGMFFRNFELTHNGRPLGPALSPAELRRGQQYLLPDGRTVTAQLGRKQGVQEEVELLLDGQPVPGSSTHPHERIKQAWYTLLFLGVLNIGLGVLAQVIDSDMLRQLGVDWVSIVIGILFLSLGWWGYSRRSALALYIAFGLFALVTVLSISAAASTGGSHNTGGLVVRFFFGLSLFRGAQAARALRADPLTSMLRT